MEDAVISFIDKNPGLKAKIIAKALNLDKTELNRLLHASNSFRKGDDFDWYLIDAKPPIVLTFDSGRWITARLFEQSLKSVGCILSSDATHVKIIFPSKCKLMLDASARLLALTNQLALSGKIISLDFSECADTRNFFSRIGFFDHLSKEVSVFPNRPEVSRAEIYRGNNKAVVEFGGIDPDCRNRDVVVQLSDSFVQLSEKSYETAAFTVFSELVGNVSEHSETPIEGFAALQRYGGYSGKGPHIQTIVSDSGLGIAHTLRLSLQEHHPELYNLFKEESIENDIGLVTKTLSEGEFSRFGTGRGLGFKSSREQSMKFKASYSVRQESFSLEFIFENGELIKVNKETGLSKILGTHICFDFYID